jgi:hypothetical protein
MIALHPVGHSPPAGEKFTIENTAQEVNKAVNGVTQARVIRRFARAAEG